MQSNGHYLKIDKNEQIDEYVDEEVIDGGEIREIRNNEYRVDPIKKQNADTARKLAFMLVVIMAVSILIQYGLIAWFLVNGHTTAFEAAKDIFSSWLPVISGLTGSAITFFFTKER